MQCKLTTYLFFLLFPILSWSQINLKGTPFMTPIEVKTMDARQIWDVEQDKNGFFYISTNVGVVRFDGKNFDLIKTPRETGVRDVFQSKSGRIYVTGTDEFGYLTTDSVNGQRFESIAKKLKGKYKNFRDSHTVLETKYGIIFMSRPFIFIYSNEKFKVLKAQKSFSGLFTNSKKELFTYEARRGLLKYTGDSLKVICPKDSIQQYSKNGFRKLVYFQGKDIFISGRGDFVEIKDEQLIKLKKIEDFSNQFIYDVVVYKKDYLIICTTRNGVYIVDKNLKIVKNLAKKDGIPANVVYSAFVDREDNIWLGTGNGIVVLHYNNGLTQMTERDGLAGGSTIVVSDEIDSKLYVGASQGVYVSDWNDSIAAKFELVKGTDGQNWSANKAQGQVIVATNNNLRAIVGKKVINGIGKISSWKAITLSQDSLTMLCGGDFGFYIIRFKYGKWVFVQNLPGFKGDCRYYEQDSKGFIWLSDAHKGVYKIKLSNKLDSCSVVKIYKKENGLPSTLGNIVYRIDDELVFGTSKGIYTYNGGTDLFEPHPIYCLRTNLRGEVRAISKDSKGNLWMNHDGNFGYIKRVSDKFIEVDTTSLKTLKMLYSENLFITKNDELIFDNTEGIVLYDPKCKPTIHLKYKTFVTKVFITVNKDSLIFGGFYHNGLKSYSENQIERDIKQLPFTLNSLKFSYAAAYVENYKKLEYQYKLKGFDKNWSSWSNKSEKEYTFLSEGNYVFKVRAKNIYDNISEIGEYQIVILPPWYRSWLAYGIYVLLGIGIIILFVKIYSKKLQRENEKLEEIIAERTSEITLQKAVLEKKNILIEDSLNYGKSIQEAVLTSENYLDEIFNEHFILFKPKDVVSGDFYWAYKSETGNIIWAVADCTGHGVPGAFMSMIGNSLINEVIIEKQEEQPDKILFNLRASLLKAFRKTDDSSPVKEGMDLGFCTLIPNKEKGGGTLQFAGAHNPVYIIRGGKLTEFKGDWQPVGFQKFKGDSEFTLHTTEVQPGDIIYLLSDGFPDQKGAKTKKKYLSKFLKEFLISIHHLPMKEQYIKLEKELVDFTGNHEQIDDITLFGVKIS